MDGDLKLYRDGTAASNSSLVLDVCSTASSAFFYSAILMLVMIILGLSFRMALACSFLAISAHEVFKL